MRRNNLEGNEFPPDAYVFGNEIGQRVKSIRTAWERARDAAALTGQAGSRFEEAGVPVSYTSKILGHTNLNTTSRYLNIRRRRLHEAMRKLEAHPRRCTTVAHADRDAPAVVPNSGTRQRHNIPRIQ
jgi:site-specific recombinase XerD